ncbi:hypothetical protein NE237_016494 [Protea cynaroides]|uniref:Uncharacterized protein n=1 Tax=Protea cynaroides TaxID=273540 RepID=A0A9Q0HH82_9MAGN|nr:hypothetical protein NE237_016494 [Protea cynaroides]
MVSDDFSFPTISESIPRFVASPSLWNVSYEVFSDSSYGTRGEKEEEKHGRKKFPMSDRDIIKLANEDMSKDDEEKMDMLWENFNDELRRVSSLRKNKEDAGRLRKGGDWDSGMSEEKAELYCVKALKMSKTSSHGIFSPKKPRLFTMVKVVKKLLLLHNSHCSKKSSIS